MKTQFPTARCWQSRDKEQKELPEVKNNHHYSYLLESKCFPICQALFHFQDVKQRQVKQITTSVFSNLKRIVYIRVGLVVSHQTPLLRITHFNLTKPIPYLQKPTLQSSQATLQSSQKIVHCPFPNGLQPVASPTSSTKRQTPQLLFCFVFGSTTRGRTRNLT